MFAGDNMIGLVMQNEIFEIFRLMDAILNNNVRKKLYKSEFGGAANNIKWVVYNSKDGISVRIMKVDNEIVGMEGQKGLTKVFFDIEDGKVVNVKFGR